MTVHEGSKFFAFGSTTADFYPTNGYGGSASGTIGDSDMADFEHVVLDALQIAANTTTAGGGGGTWTLKDASGTTIQAWIIPSTDATGGGGEVGREIPLGWLIPGRGGFTMASSDTDCSGVCTYRTIKRTIGPT